MPKISFITSIAWIEPMMPVQRAEDARLLAGRQEVARRRFGMKAAIGRIGRAVCASFRCGLKVESWPSNWPTAAETSVFFAR